MVRKNTQVENILMANQNKLREIEQESRDIIVNFFKSELEKNEGRIYLDCTYRIEIEYGDIVEINAIVLDGDNVVVQGILEYDSSCYDVSLANFDLNTMQEIYDAFTNED